MSKLFFILLFLITFSCFSQQRIGLEFFSRFDGLSVGTHYQKVIYSKFIVGAGLVWVTKRRGEIFQDKSETPIYTAIRSVDPSFDRSGEKYVVQGSRTTSKALMITLNTGFFHEFGAIHGVRINLNARIGISNNTGTYLYSGMINDSIIPIKHIKNHLVTGISPEIYHTLRQRQKLTFYYGVRFPVWFSLDKRNFNPAFRKEGFYGLEMELAIGVTYFIGKKKVEDD
ncbi:hypothetical protein [Fluviicola taffensis]|uniref:Outer membrane protein beta-barrel domain-containing protein n=1 Tax=Fluviicola taffensis (strain DSM 16823 / NCIMB 13979 / RW262) TaxID=755732 RepID=F2ICF0_FLUTR|nr:hypothetical protein [Fluviicola taffensis]AEA45420.1 hypothetical protein Fluta_3448 [Fluviicola taffensis DSM 16823]